MNEFGKESEPRALFEQDYLKKRQKAYDLLASWLEANEQRVFERKFYTWVLEGNYEVEVQAIWPLTLDEDELPERDDNCLSIRLTAFSPNIGETSEVATIIIDLDDPTDITIEVADYTKALIIVDLLSEIEVTDTVLPDIEVTKRLAGYLFSAIREHQSKGDNADLESHADAMTRQVLNTLIDPAVGSVCASLCVYTPFTKKEKLTVSRDTHSLTGISIDHQQVSIGWSETEGAGGFYAAIYDDGDFWMSGVIEDRSIQVDIVEPTELSDVTIEELQLATKALQDLIDTINRLSQLVDIERRSS